MAIFRVETQANGIAHLVVDDPARKVNVLSAEALRRAGCFDPERVERLLLKLERGGPVGEKDNMAFLGILSTQRLHDTLVRDYLHWAGPRAPER